MNKMKAKDIENALKQRYSMDPASIRGENKGNDTWVVYEQFYSDVGGYGRKRICDFMAFKLWNEGLTIVAHEIKVSKSDFKQDVEDFQNKQGLFMDFSTEFYYVCPWGLIAPDEVPEGTGLMYVNKGNKVVIKKQAPHRPKKQVPMGVFKSFVARQARGVKRFSLPLSYLEKNITEEEFKKLVDKEVKELVIMNVGRQMENFKEKELNHALQTKMKEMDIYKDKWMMLLEYSLPQYIISDILKSKESIISFAVKVYKFVYSDVHSYGLRQSLKLSENLLKNLKELKDLRDFLNKEHVMKLENEKIENPKQLPLEKTDV